MSDNPFADLDEEFDEDDDDATNFPDDIDGPEDDDASPARTPSPDDEDDAADGETTAPRSDAAPRGASSDDGAAGSEPASGHGGADPSSDGDDGVGTRRTVDPTTTEAFDYSPEMQQAVYARPSTWEAFEDAMELDMERVFREHDVRNMSKREIHDALFAFAADHADDIARRALRARGIDADDEDDR